VLHALIADRVKPNRNCWPGWTRVEHLPSMPVALGNELHGIAHIEAFTEWRRKPRRTDEVGSRSTSTISGTTRR